MMCLLAPFLKADFCSQNREQSKAGLSGGEVNARYLEKTVWGGHPGRGCIYCFLLTSSSFFSVWQRIMVKINVGIE